MSFFSFYLRKKFWLNDFLHGAKMWKHYQDIRFINTNVLQGEFRRKQYLERLLLHATKHTKFYHGINPLSLANFPVINKSIILDRYQDFLVPFEEIPNQSGELHIQKTSGSTGTPFSIPQDTNCRLRRIATLKYGNELIDFHSFDLLMQLRAFHHYTGKSDTFTYNRNLQIIYVSNNDLTQEKIARIVDAINSFKVKFIRGYMTTLDFITRYVVENSIELVSHPTFISGGELLSEELRLRIVDRLKCKIISQYATEESGVLGQTKINGIGSEIILNRANCFFEILALDSDTPAKVGELGRIVVTDLFNYALPLIRYDIGDVACVGEVENNVITSICHLCGRKTDLIYRTNGQPVDMYNSISTLIYNNPEISQWQFIQNNTKEYSLKLSLRKFGKLSVENQVRKQLLELLGQDAMIDIFYVDNIPVMNSGKRKTIICNL